MLPPVPGNIFFWAQCIEAHLCQGQGGEGRVLGRFHHDSAAGCQGGPHLPRDHGAGEIPLHQKREEGSERKDCALVQRRAGQDTSQQVLTTCLAEAFLQGSSGQLPPAGSRERGDRGSGRQKHLQSLKQYKVIHTG